MCLSNEYEPKRKHVHQKSIWNLEGHHSFQNIIGHFDWNPNFGSTSQGYNSFMFYYFEVGSNALESLRCLIQMLCCTKFHNPKRNTCDNTKHYRSLWTKAIESWKSPTSSAHNFLIKNPNGAQFKSKFIVLKRSITFKLKVFPFEAFIIETEGLEVGHFWQNFQIHVLYIKLHGQFSQFSKLQMDFCPT